MRKRKRSGKNERKRRVDRPRSVPLLSTNKYALYDDNVESAGHATHPCCTVYKQYEELLYLSVSIIQSLLTIFCHVLFHLILDYSILSSYLILPYLTLSYLILSYPILSYLTLSYLILSYPILSYLILSYLTLPYLTLPYLILPYLT